MKKALLVVLIVVIAGLVILTAISRPLYIGIPLIGVWIYLVWMVRKKKTDIFHSRMEPELAESRLKMLKTFLTVAAISLPVGIVGVVVHNVIYGLSEKEEPVSFLIALAGLFVFIVATVGGLAVFLIGRRKTTQRNTVINTT